MNARRKHRLIEIEWPHFGRPSQRPPPPSAHELSGRIGSAIAAMERRGLTHLVIYGDREHFANLAFLTNFDPRFEEALCVLSAKRSPLLLVGNECQDYLPISPLFAEKGLRTELFQPFSLLDQPRDASRRIDEIFRDEGIGQSSRVGCVGWKYFEEQEVRDAAHALDLPSYLADALRNLAGHDGVVNATALFMHAHDGLRSFCSALDIVRLEHANILSSEAVRRILHSVQEGKTDHELVQAAQYDGTPLCTYLNVKTGPSTVALASPRGDVVKRGNRISCNVAYWGSNSCRVGWVAETAQDLPPAAREYVPSFAGIYFEAIAEWYRLLDVGVSGGVVAQAMDQLLPSKVFNVTLNPGHLIQQDEWVSSPFYKNSTIPLHSGMAIQCDVIPSSPIFGSTRMEDGIVLCDAILRRELADRYPETWSRCQARRQFMTKVLGFELSDAVLLLSNIDGIVPPFFLRPGQVLALEP